MKIHRWFSLSVILAALTVGAVTFGCSKSSKAPTNPGGGGGGATNTPFDSGVHAAPFSFQRTFPTAAAVGYHCTPHQGSGMTGTVTVSMGSPATASVTVSSAGNALSFSPSNVSIAPGGTVTWTWAGTMGHTVTSN
jgi:plastocyanin